MTEKLLDLRYKGGRTYLHGTDIYAGVLGWLEDELQLGEIRNIDVSFHHLATSALRAVLDDPAPEAGVEPAAVFAFEAGGQRRRVRLLETGAAVEGRYPYPEDEIVAPAAFDAATKTIALPRPADYRDIELWVALTKAMHARALPQIGGKWLFVRGRFPAPTHCPPAATLSLTLAANFNDKLTRSEARIDGARVGEIFFSVV